MDKRAMVWWSIVVVIIVIVLLVVFISFFLSASDPGQGAISDFAQGMMR